MKIKKVRVVLSPEAEEVYIHLNKEAPTSKTERMILNAIKKKIDLLKINPHYGDPIAKNLIPPSTKRDMRLQICFELSYRITGECSIHLPIVKQKSRSSLLSLI
jgi:hypothetical protein